MTNHVHLLVSAADIDFELNPVRALMVRSPGEYPWSSFNTNAFGVASTFIEPHPEFLRLGAAPEVRQAAYLGMLSAGLAPSDLAAVRGAINANAALGSERFVKEIEGWLQRTARIIPRGRPVGPVSAGRKMSLSPV